MISVLVDPVACLLHLVLLLPLRVDVHMREDCFVKTYKMTPRGILDSDRPFLFLLLLPSASTIEAIDQRQSKDRKMGTLERDLFGLTFC